MGTTFFLRNALSLFLLAPVPWSAANAGEAHYVELGNTLPGRGDLTYADLTRLVVPDLTNPVGGSYAGTKLVDIRAIGGEDSGGSPPESVALRSAEVAEVKSNGKPLLAMLLDVGGSSESAEGFAPLALYDVSGAPRLIDVVNVASDRDTSFRDPGSLEIAPGTDAVFTASTHFNSSQGYAISPLMMIRNDHLELIDTVYTFDENVCGYRRTQTIGYQAIPEDRPYAAIKVTVTETTAPTDEQCEQPPPAASVRDIVVTYHWDATASRYVADSDAFQKLSAENAERF